MARIARVVVPGAPHHVTQRGARRMQVFFTASDYEVYRQLLLEKARSHSVSIWAYCLMPNHVHLIAVPADTDGLSRALAEAHRRYAVETNARHGWRGHLWQERFWSFPMDDSSLRAVTRYVLLNPVRAGMVRRAEEWPFSSARRHLHQSEDMLVDGQALDSRISDWTRLLCPAEDEGDAATVRRHSATGRPLGEEAYVSRIETLLGRQLRAGRRGRRRKSSDGANGASLKTNL